MERAARVGASRDHGDLRAEGHGARSATFRSCFHCKTETDPSKLGPYPGFPWRDRCVDRDACKAAEEARFRAIFHDNPILLRAGEQGMQNARAFVRGGM